MHVLHVVSQGRILSEGSSVMRALLNGMSLRQSLVHTASVVIPNIWGVYSF